MEISVDTVQGSSNKRETRSTMSEIKKVTLRIAALETVRQLLFLASARRPSMGSSRSDWMCLPRSCKLREMAETMQGMVQRAGEQTEQEKVLRAEETLSDVGQRSCIELETKSQHVEDAVVRFTSCGERRGQLKNGDDLSIQCALRWIHEGLAVEADEGQA